MYLLITCYLIIGLNHDPTYSYIKCSSSGLGSTTYAFNSDSSVMKRESGERWRGRNMKIGKWKKEEKGLSFNDAKGFHIYKSDTVSTVAILIGVEHLEEWNDVRREIVNELNNNEDLKIFHSFTSIESEVGQKQNVIHRFESNLVLRKLCGKNIMVEEINLKE